MMWNAFFMKRLSSIVSKGKQVEDEWGFSNSENKQSFLKLCVEFLDSFMETHVLNEDSAEEKVSSLKSTEASTSKNANYCTVTSRRKNLWSSRGHPNNGNNNEAPNSKSLIELALLQPKTTYEMILLHYQLALVAYFGATYNIRKTSMRPMNFFDTKVGY